LRDFIIKSPNEREGEENILKLVNESGREMQA
jgi:hypothetical protein